MRELNIKRVDLTPDQEGLFETTLPTSKDIVKLKLLTYGEETMIDKEMELDDKVLDRIISIGVSDFDLNTGNPKYQLDKSRVLSKF